MVLQPAVHQPTPCDKASSCTPMCLPGLSSAGREPHCLTVVHARLGQVRLLNIGELRKDLIGALTFGASIPPYKDGALPSSPKLRYAFPTAPTWQVC